MRTHPLQITKIIWQPTRIIIITPKIVVISTQRTAAIYPIKIHYLIVK